ncbi:Na+/H+ antiporter NhaC family protein [uncultured Fusobacterium sp.]|uniref:Na+/H+ antiporter NhaC family protein n=1 Tax=uncultured Fusobacterium sp. TaxID=159267 RepID=UPI0025DA202F|nr:Na+/H+ antiporter NhaC family protein [uncultured Fusobacterium sp.]
MKKYLGVMVVILTMSLSILADSYIGIGVNLVLILLSLLALKKGLSLEEIIDSGFSSGKKAFLVMKIFLLVGAVSSIWIMSGTIPIVVYQGVRLMNPEYFYLSSFLITSVVAFLLGSSFGTAGTVGIAMIAIGKGLGADLSIVGGTVISGAYFGDRCSPVSSSANLVATLTETNLYTNIKNMFKTGSIPFIITGILYVFCNSNGDKIVKNISMLELLESNFNLSYLNFLPIGIILFLTLFRTNVKISLSLSILAAIFLSFFIQGYEIIDIFKTLIFGFFFEEKNPLYNILKGGGVISMWKTCMIVFISCCLSGIIQKLQLFNKLESFILKSKNEMGLYIWTMIVSIITGMFGCNQSIAVVMTIDIMKNSYKIKEIAKEKFAIDIENSAIVLSALIPWNLASLVPATVMEMKNFEYLIYSFYVILLPIFTLTYKKLIKK